MGVLARRLSLICSAQVRHICSQTNTIPSEAIEAALSEDSKRRVAKQLARIKPRGSLLDTCTDEAGVLIPLCRVHTKPSVLFTLRSNKLAKHSGEVR